MARAARPGSVAGFVVGAIYDRRYDVHRRLGGQWQYLISTPVATPFVIAFTSVAGLKRGCLDYWDDRGFFHYFGQGQLGDMELEGGNKALLNHVVNGKRLLVFQSLGSRQHRFLGEFVCVGHEWLPDVPDSEDKLRLAVAFKLLPQLDEVGSPVEAIPPWTPDQDVLGLTVSQYLTQVRSKQELFRRRVAGIERGCRLTGVHELRFLRATHIKPWAASNDAERVDAYNGLLLTPTADLLFDLGWISFSDKGKLMVASQLPSEIREKTGLNLTVARGCGRFEDHQKDFLAYHRDCVFEDRAYQGALEVRLFD